MKTLAILQARMSSSRLPGKVLAPLEGKPMILRQLERISRATSLDQIVVATSTDVSDDRLAEVLEQEEIALVRGDLTNVLARFIATIEEYQPDVVVRLTADCPLISPTVIDAVVARFLSAGNFDYVSNTLSPTFPDGLDVEVVRADVLRDVARYTNDPAEQEHVTLGVYRHPEKYALLNFENEIDYSNLRWTVDTLEDLKFVEEIYADLYQSNPGFDLRDVLDLLEKTPSLNRTTADVGRNQALWGLDTGAMRNHTQGQTHS